MVENVVAMTAERDLMILVETGDYLKIKGTSNFAVSTSH